MNMVFTTKLFLNVGRAVGAFLSIALVLTSARLAAAPVIASAAVHVSPTASLSSVAFGKDRFVAAGDRGTVLWSTDGLTWTSTSSGSEDLHAVAWGPDRFFAVGDRGTVITSLDGMAWSTTPFPVVSSLVSVAASRTTVLVLSDDGRLFTAIDGRNWAEQKLPEGAVFSAVAYENGLFVGLGRRGLWTSVDGKQWSQSSLTTGAASFASSNDALVAVGSWTVHSSTSLSAEWKPVSLPGVVSDLIFADGSFVGVGQQGFVITSEDGDNWNVRPSGVRSHLTSIAYGADTFVSVGDFGTLIASRDGVAWHEPMNVFSRVTSGKEFDLTKLTYGSGKFVAVGNHGAVLTSINGEDWVLRPSNSIMSLLDVTYGHGLFVAVGIRSTVLVSSDSIDWKTIKLPGDWWSCCTAVTAGEDGFVILGDGRIWTSKDAETWFSHVLDHDASAIEYAGGQYVAVGNEYVYTSSEGTRWEAHRSWKAYQALRGLAHGPSQFVAVGTYGTVATSSDGSNWIERTSRTLTPDLPQDWLNGVVHGGKLYVAVGNNGVVMKSVDGRSWVPKRVTQTNLNGVHYAQNRFVAVGEFGTVIWSLNGEDWFGTEVLPSGNAPKEPTISKSCGGIGDRVHVSGYRLSGAKVWFGETQARTDDSGSLLTAYVPHNAAAGPVTIRWDNGRTVVIAPSFTVAPVSVGRVVMTQGIEGFPLIWGKQTLFQVFPIVPKASPCPVTVEGGSLYLEYADGTKKGPFVGIAGQQRPGITLNPGATVTGDLDQAINFLLPSNAFEGSPDALASIRVSLSANGETIVDLPVIQASKSATFTDVRTQSRLLRGIIVYFSVTDVPRDPLWQRDLTRMLKTVARSYPVPDNLDNLFPLIVEVELPEPVVVDSDSLQRLTGAMLAFLAEYNANREESEQAHLVAGILDKTARKDGALGMAWLGTPRGLAPWAASLSLNGSGHTLGQEIGHNYGLVLPVAPNVATHNQRHSRYDEGVEAIPSGFIFRGCLKERTFGQSLQDQLTPKPESPQRVINLVDLVDFPVGPDCDGPAKSIMSYAPYSTDFNSFLEYADYKYLLEKMGDRPDESSAVDSANPSLFAERISTVPSSVLEMIGTLTTDGTVDVSFSRVVGGHADPPHDDSPYSVVFRDAAGAILGRHPFYVSFLTSGSGNHPGTPTLDSTTFMLRAPFPVQTGQVEIRYDDNIIGTFSVPQAKPSVRITSPARNSESRMPLQVTWQATAPEGGPLFTTVSWSKDGGQTFSPAAVEVNGQSVTLQGASLPSGRIVIRVEVSDGFNVSSDTVEVTIPPKPIEPIIMEPRSGTPLSSNIPVRLSGSATLPGGGWVEPGDLSWSSDLDGELGQGDSIVVLLSKGTHQLTLRAAKDGYVQGSTTIIVNVGDPMTCGTVFPDVPAHSDACLAVESLVASKIISGYPDGTFRPGQTVTRAEFAKMLVLALGKEPNQNLPARFSDSIDHWAAKQGFLQMAQNLNAINGYPDGTFRPNDMVTRAQVVKVVAAAIGLPPGGSPPYADIAESEWFTGWVSSAYASGLIGPSSATALWPYAPFNANKPVTRAEAAIILANLRSR